jgi:hypothetical protein
MSQLEPGAAYVYERDGTRIYARKVGETERRLIGEDFISDHRRVKIEIAEEWFPIIRAAEQNPALQEAIERVKILYELSRQDQPIAHHPV